MRLFTKREQHIVDNFLKFWAADILKPQKLFQPLIIYKSIYHNFLEWTTWKQWTFLSFCS